MEETTDLKEHVRILTEEIKKLSATLAMLTDEQNTIIANAVNEQRTKRDKNKIGILKKFINSINH